MTNTSLMQLRDRFLKTILGYLVLNHGSREHERNIEATIATILMLNRRLQAKSRRNNGGCLIGQGLRIKRKEQVIVRGTVKDCYIIYSR